MSRIVPNGHPAALVSGAILQELDAQRNVVFQWRSWDHYPFSSQWVNATNAVISAFHVNCLFQDTDVKPGLLRSYLFFAIELTGEGYARGMLTGIARQINRVFPMPVMVLIKHVADKKPVLSFAVINRRQNKRDRRDRRHRR